MVVGTVFQTGKDGCMGTEKATGIHERIDELIRKEGISRRKLALKAGIAPATLQSALADKRSISFDTLNKIAGVFNVPVNDLLEGTEISHGKMFSADRGFLTVLESIYDNVAFEWDFLPPSLNCEGEPVGEPEFTGGFHVTISQKGREDIILDPHDWKTLFESVCQSIPSYVELIWSYKMESYHEPDNYHDE